MTIEAAHSQPSSGARHAVADAPARSQPDAVRYHGLDALRGVAMMLGIVLHAALLYAFADEAARPTDSPAPRALVGSE